MISKINFVFTYKWIHLVVYHFMGIMYGRAQPVVVGSPLPLESWGLVPHHHNWQQTPLPTEPCH